MYAGPAVHHLLEQFVTQLYNSDDTSIYDISRKLTRAIEDHKAVLPSNV